MLAYQENRHKGIILNVDHCKDLSPKHFKQELIESLVIWQKQGFLTVWITLNQTKSDFIPIITELGFNFHHTKKNTLTLVKKLVETAFVPDYAHHSIGVGGLVIKDNKILTIVEKNDIKTRPKHFKLPGGMVDQNELLETAVKREVFEETGIQSDVLGLVGFRHNHMGPFNTSNIYFVFHLQPLSTDIIMCPEEIAIAEWIDINDYLQDKDVLVFNKAWVKSALSRHYLKRNEIDGYMNNNLSDYEVYLGDLYENFKS